MFLPKITLIQPKNPYKIAYGSGLLRPLGLHLLASYLEKHGFRVEILDLRIGKNKEMPFDQLIKDNDSEIFGITGFTASRFQVAEMAKCIKKMKTGSYVVVGGWHFTHCARETLEKIKDIDVVVKGTGLSEIVEIAKRVSQKTLFEKIPSIAYRDGDKIIENSRPSICINIDEIPSYTRFSIDDYPEYLRTYPEDTKAIGVYSSLGCPGRCIFCSKVIEGYSLRDGRKFVEEIALFKDRFNIQAFNFVDMSFTGSPGHVREVSQEIISRKIKIKWWCESRVDVPLDILEIMKQAGCVSMSVGVESGSNKVLSTISKGISVEKILNFCRKCNDLGIFLNCFFMYSHLGETNRDVKETFELIKKLNKSHFIQIGVFQPTMILPGSQLETIARKHNIIKKDFSWYEPYDSRFNEQLNQIPNIPIFLDILKPHELIRIHKRAQMVRLTVKGKIIKIIGIFLKKLSPAIFFKAKNLYEMLKKPTLSQVQHAK